MNSVPRNELLWGNRLRIEGVQGKKEVEQRGYCRDVATERNGKKRR